MRREWAYFFAAGLLLFFLSGFSFGQSTAKRISVPVNDSDRALLPGGVHPRTSRSADQGGVPAGMPLQRMAIFFNLTPAQKQDLQKLLSEQQDPTSPNYHKWLTPEQYADRFGVNAADLAKITAWLQSHGFRDVSASRSRTSIEFDGTAAQVQSAFRTSIHYFVQNGKTHYANTVSPSLPSAFAEMVSGITSLNDFRPHPMSIAHFTSNVSGKHFLAPGDIGTIYNVKSLYDVGIDGSGQAIAVVGQTPLTQTDDGTHADIDTFRSLGKNLPPINLQQVKVGTVSFSKGDVDEANLDLEWTGAMAPKAAIIFVYSSNALFTSLPDIVNNNRAPVISISYGSCEGDFGASDISTLVNITQQANAQGQSIIAASGDSGATDCDGSASSPATIATHGLAVDVPSSLQNVTGMGGTQFNGDASACPPNDVCPNGTAPDTQYWKGSSSKSDTSASALSYIPETVWNSTSPSGIAAGGGGVSKLISKPSWQTGSGVPQDGQRDVPDISLTSSPDHDGYLICSQGSCVNGYRRSDDTLNVIGGTSAASPVFSGVVALMVQQLNTRLGNMNPTLYSLAGSASSAFHDITTGDNKVPCQKGSTDCPNGGTIGYSAAPGYDLASGLGTVDVGALVSAWSGSITPDFKISASPASLSLTRGANGSATISIAAVGNLSGTVALSCAVSSSLGTTTCAVNPNNVTPGQNATLTVTATSSAALKRTPFPWGFEMSFAIAALFSIPYGRSRSNSRAMRKAILTFLALVLVIGMVACGGGGGSNSNGNSVATLTGSVTVQATSGSLNHSVTIPVTIN
jgi:subtilase family serine protease